MLSEPKSARKRGGRPDPVPVGLECPRADLTGGGGQGMVFHVLNAVLNLPSSFCFEDQAFSSDG